MPMAPAVTLPEPAARLHERDAELHRIAAALDAVEQGEGDLLLVEGPAGIGKTALLATARAMAAERGLRVLGARASEIDRDLAFGVVRQLLEPPLRRVDETARGRLLAGSARLAAPVLGLPDAVLTPESGPATLNGLFWLLGNLVVEDGPHLLTIDDAHWADPATARLLAFLAPRLGDVGCLVLVATRPDEPGSALTLAASASDPAARAMVPSPLSADGCGAIVAERFGDGAEAEFVAACHAVSGGNPFYLRALAEQLHRDGVAPTAASAPAVRAANPSSISQTIVARLGTLGPACSALAGALAVLDAATGLLTAAAVAGLDPDEAVRAADELERAGVVTGDDDRVDLVHAVVRNAVDADLGRVRRATLHRRAAERLAEEGASPERVAAHLLTAPATGDEADLATLRSASAEALRRGAPDSAAVYLGRALAEPLTDDRRAAILLLLGVAETSIDLGAAADHLRQAFELAVDADRRTLSALVLARAVFFTERSRDSIRVARDALDRLDPEGAGELRRGLEAVVLAAASMDPAERSVAEELAARLRAEGIEGDDFTARALEAGLVHLDARAGMPAAEAVRRMEGALRGDVLLNADNGRAAFCAAAMVLALADSDRALPVLEAGIAAATANGDVVALSGDRIFACLAHLVRGRLADAVASGEEGLAHVDAHGGAIALPWGCGLLAAAHLERGDLDAAEEALGRAGVSGEVPHNAHWITFLDSRGRVRAGRGDLQGGLEDALECGRRFESLGGRNPAFLPWRSRAAELLARLGEEPARARRLAAEEVEAAEAWGAPRALGAALRAHGVVLDGDAGVERLRAAVEVLDGSPARLEHARALVDLGARLRRAGGRAQARALLSQGLELARSCGALPLGERAYDELRATGARPRRILRTGVDALTPSELRVARLAAGGAANREIAQELYVTTKTVEFHLSNAYRKLDISSREDLPAALEGRVRGGP